MLAKLGLLIGAPFALMALTVGATGLVVVEVQEEDGVHLTIPVPLVLAQAAMGFAPEEARYVECAEFAPYQDVAVKVLEELKDQPDFVMVEVHDGDDHVLVEKVGKNIRVKVRGEDGERVDVKFPLKSALKAVKAYDGEGFPAQAMMGALKNARFGGTLVHVIDGADEVKVSLY